MQQFVDAAASLSETGERLASVARDLKDGLTEERTAAIDQMAENLTSEREAAIEQFAEILAVEREDALNQLFDGVAKERQEILRTFEEEDVRLRGLLKSMRLVS